jgi:hypothetical protein
MKLVVKLWREHKKNFSDHNQHMPDHWPAHCLELSDDAPIPDGYFQTSVEELSENKTRFKHLYDRWIENHYLPNGRKRHPLAAALRRRKK